ncbi:MAG: HAMP domain-containing histidine kinase [Treponema sp.]|nr:HAMP domain-containing histidine kinase [Treponema sp.]
MKHRVKSGVFGKIFAYTLLLLVLMSLAALVLFSREFLSYYEAEQERFLSSTFQPMLSVFEDRNLNPEELSEIARVFSDQNRSFMFTLQGDDGRLLFTSLGEERSSHEPLIPNTRLRVVTVLRDPEGSEEREIIFTGFSSREGSIDYQGLLRRLFLAMALMFLIATLGAVLFAKRVTKPLEDEIVRRHAMEESQKLFFSAASHELKTPIAAARALVEGMIAGVGDYTDHPKYLRECLKTLDSQGALVGEILDLLKLSEEGASVQMASIDLAEIGKGVLGEYLPLAAEGNIAIQGDFPSARVWGDPYLLSKVLSNVLANAVQNTPPGGSIRIETRDDQKGFVLSILNTGASIPEEHRLFEPFMTADPARSHHGRQGGLGLAIVKRALDQMNCPFGLENHPEGVLFWVRLPA